MQYIFIINSAIVTGCSGAVSVDNGPQAFDAAEAEILRIFRSVSTREQVELMRQAYEYEERQEKRKSPRK